MPFDGIGFGGTQQTGVWGRLARLAKALLPETKPEPVWVPDPGQISRPHYQTLQVLTVARSLIEDRGNWVQRRYETRDGRRCAVGALRGAARMLNLHGQQQGAHSVLLAVAMTRGFSDIESMNDNSSHRQVLSAFDEAIANVTMRQAEFA